MNSTILLRASDPASKRRRYTKQRQDGTVKANLKIECSKCKQTKSWLEFPRKTYTCKVCWAHYMKTRVQKPKPKADYLSKAKNFALAKSWAAIGASIQQ